MKLLPPNVRRTRVSRTIRLKVYVGERARSFRLRVMHAVSGGPTFRSQPLKSSAARFTVFRDDLALFDKWLLVRGDRKNADRLCLSSR